MGDIFSFFPVLSFLSPSSLYLHLPPYTHRRRPVCTAAKGNFQQTTFHYFFFNNLPPLSVFSRFFLSPPNLQIHFPNQMRPQGHHTPMKKIQLKLDQTDNQETNCAKLENIRKKKEKNEPLI